jgi:ferredoxin
VSAPAFSIKVDRDVCMGSGLCCVYAPNTFDVDDVPRAYVRELPGDSLEVIRAAVAACPTGALTIVEEGT